MSAHSHMLDEIQAQPDCLRRTYAKNIETCSTIANELKKRSGVNFALLIGRGTSDNAATYAKYVFALTNGLPCGLAAPSLMNLHKAPLRLDRALVIARS